MTGAVLTGWNNDPPGRPSVTRAHSKKPGLARAADRIAHMRQRRHNVSGASVIWGTAWGASRSGRLPPSLWAAIALAGLWGAPVSGASMDRAPSLGPALVLNDWTS